MDQGRTAAARLERFLETVVIGASLPVSRSKKGCSRVRARAVRSDLFRHTVKSRERTARRTRCTCPSRRLSIARPRRLWKDRAMMRSRSALVQVDSKWLLTALVLASCASNSPDSSSAVPEAGVESSPEAADASAAGHSSTSDEDGAGRDAGSGPATVAVDAGTVGQPADGVDAASSEAEQTTAPNWLPGQDDAGTTHDTEGNTGTGNASAIPEGTLLYVYHQTADSDLLVARDLETGDEVVITDLTGDGSSGWDIEGFALSPDRRRIALASLYNPTDDDVATGLATRAIWTLSTDGTDFQRLTPTFPNESQGRTGFQYSVDYPEWTAEGSQVLYNFGTYWWEGTTLEGGTFPWIVAADGSSLPTTFTISAPCTVIHPSRNPITGDFLFIHSVCVPGQGDGDGVYLYPASGSDDAQQLVSSTRVEGGVDVFLGKPAWLPDGSGFLFMGGTADTDWNVGLLIYDMQEGTIAPLLPPPTDAAITSVTMSGDASKIVYCSRDSDGNEDLHVIDLSLEAPTDTAITNDGKSCDPSF